tara:strand:+ start:115 stop:549 length:435 start_codon:yes stop_codon:yes gene_type:complete
MRQNPNKILSTSFLKGLEEYNLTPEDIEQSKWRYCGGNKESRLKYWKLTCPKDDLPEHIDKCVCGVKIVENCYITNGIYILILGNKCIQKFEYNRICSKCENPHNNRVVDKCNACRLCVCDICGVTIKKSYNKCLDCKKNTKKK